jgi:hypothetical protein
MMVETGLRLHRLSELGQPVWIDYLSRELVESDALTWDGNGIPAMTRML